jgi:trimethylamine--corrinoid protein Co-methyltransferase
MVSRVRRNRRAARREERGRSPLLTLPFHRLRNPLPPLEFLPVEEVNKLHLASMHILENVGIEFLDDEALAIWEKAGAKVDRKAKHVWPDRGLISEAVAEAPQSFTWRARNPDRNLTIGGPLATSKNS